jgi:hypothetical protein
MTHVGGEGTGCHLYRRLLPGFDKVHARFYVKFDTECARVHHLGTRLGGCDPSTPWPWEGARARPDGRRRFATGVEPFGTAWEWDFDTYWQGARSDDDGRRWGTPFLTGGSRPAVVRDAWICVEMMVKLNDPPGEPNGEQAFWIDGRLWRRDGQVVSHIGPGFPRGEWAKDRWRSNLAAKKAFEGFRWRSIERLAVNYVWAGLYVTQAPDDHRSTVWFDNIVIATDYIGPIVRPKKSSEKTGATLGPKP